MPYNFDYVINKLEDGNVRFDVLQTSDESVAIILPDFNRILGVWPDTDKPCPFWINDKFLENPNNTSADWQNPGGHRIWIAPEKEFFFADITKPFETYNVPEMIDPGIWDYSINDSEIIFSCDVRLHAFRLQKKVSLKIKRVIRPLGRVGAQRNIPFEIDSCKCAGYEEEVQLICFDDLKVGLWSLIQVPLNGEMIMPVRSNGMLTKFFGDGSRYISVEDTGVKVKYDAKSNIDFKVGLDVASITDKIYYCCDIGSGFSSLIIQDFTKDENAEYVDKPWDFDDVQGSAVQAFCGGNYGFGEIEVHYPVRRSKEGCCISSGKSKILSVILDRDSKYVADSILNMPYGG